MVKEAWTSQGLYEHPAKHNAGTYGKIVLHNSGIYGFMVGGVHMSCPQDWAAGIHAEETGQMGSMIIRKVPGDLRRKFKSKCAAAGISQQDKIIDLMKDFVRERRGENDQ
jgi:S-formylglutathione hydrolase FrmB